MAESFQSMSKELSHNLGGVASMTLTVNGAAMSIQAGKSLQELLELVAVPLGQIAVERNLEIVPRERYPSTILQPGDELEIVTLMGGG
ncbi:MAG: sulfur carrier protein ThiS [Pirellulaceae bacterium]